MVNRYQVLAIGKVSLKTFWWVFVMILGAFAANPVLHEIGHLLAATALGYEVIDVNLWSYNGDHASVWVESADRDSLDFFLFSLAGAGMNLLLAAYATFNWNKVEQALSFRWPSLGFAAMGFILMALANALYILPVSWVSGMDTKNIQTFMELNGYVYFGINGTWFVGATMLAIVAYLTVYFIRINTTPLEVKFVG
ncbi:hypothetical protein [Haloglomus salinum]|uniref:hypothetical protein n=1 Tax=Haloglomus salinum TaxID=2962673 RepID=UPI0020C9583C|nr:hypothetical protein [Haloglomus salinum]